MLNCMLGIKLFCSTSRKRKEAMGEEEKRITSLFALSLERITMEGGLYV